MLISVVFFLVVFVTITVSHKFVCVKCCYLPYWSRIVKMHTSPIDIYAQTFTPWYPPMLDAPLFLIEWESCSRCVRQFEKIQTPFWIFAGGISHSSGHKINPTSFGSYFQFEACQGCNFDSNRDKEERSNRQQELSAWEWSRILLPCQWTAFKWSIQILCAVSLWTYCQWKGSQAGNSCKFFWIYHNIDKHRPPVPGLLSPRLEYCYL